MNDKYINIYACCLLVRGAKRSIICDTQRDNYQLIPNSLYEILSYHKHKNIEEIKVFYKQEFNETIDEYFSFLVENEYAFWCDKEELDLFPAIDLTWDEPAHITNAIIDINEASNLDFTSIIQQFENIGCRHFQLRAYSTKQLSYFEEILENLENKAILSAEFIIKFNEETNLENLEKLTNKFPRVHNIIVHSAQENIFAKIDPSKMGNIIYVKQNIDSQVHCGFIGQDYFSINLKTFTESQRHNTCLNRKISIDVNGEIKNCPSMTKSYGNIKDTTLKEAIEKAGFKDVWNIHKEQIEVCKDCEFRHICTDCRAYIQDPSNIYSKPAKCGYDPYTATWGEENPTNNPLHGQ